MPVIRSTSYTKSQDFYEKPSKNYDALSTLGEKEVLTGFVMTTFNKLHAMKSDIVRTDEQWETWKMHNLIDSIYAWLRRNKVDESVKEAERKEKHWFAGDSSKERRKPKCIYCDAGHWSDKCDKYESIEERKQHFKKIGFVLIVVRKGTEKTNVSVEDAITAKQNTILACVTKEVKALSLQDFHHLLKRACLL